jgi:hypothetical protein
MVNASIAERWSLTRNLFFPERGTFGHARRYTLLNQICPDAASSDLPA